MANTGYYTRFWKKSQRKRARRGEPRISQIDADFWVSVRLCVLAGRFARCEHLRKCPCSSTANFVRGAGGPIGEADWDSWLGRGRFLGEKEVVLAGGEGYLFG